MISLRKFFKRGPADSSGEINPDEILLDAHNLPQFDTQQFEGVIEKPIAKRAVVLLGITFILVGAVFSWRLGELQIARGEQFAAQSAQNRLQQIPVFADRGVMYDRTGKELAWNTPNPDATIPSRAYIEDDGFAHVLGYVKPPAKDKNGFFYREHFVGIAGLESAYDNKLRGTNGIKLIETNALGEVTSKSITEKPLDGDNLTLTIDRRIQGKLYELLAQTADEHSFQGGAGVIMDIDNGNTLALASYPEYDPEVLSRGENEEVIRSYNRNREKPFLNRAVSGLYTPGSIVKPFVAVGALEEGVVTPQTKIVSTGSISIPNPYFPDKETVFTDWKAHGPVNITEALAVSSNVYFYEVGGGYKDQEGIGIKNIETYTRMFGLGESTDIGLAQEPKGVIPTPEWKAKAFDGEPWRIGDTYNTAIGQYGFQVTPLQMARAVAAIANDGTLREPKIIEAQSSETEELPVSDAHLSVVQEGMRRAVRDGTAKGLNVSYAKIAAKTGTAEVGVDKQRVNSWVIGFYPYEDPHYAFAVVMERGPRKNTIGGLFVMRRLFDWMQREFGTIMPGDPENAGVN